MPKRTPERIAEAVSLAAQGLSLSKIGAVIGCSPTTAKLLLDPIAYERHKAYSVAWTAAHPEAASKSRGKYRSKPAVRDRMNSRNRVRYATDMDYRSRRDNWTAEYRQGLQPRLASTIRSMTWALASGAWSVPWRPFAKECVGIQLHELAMQLASSGSSDHIVPLCCFDLTDSVQLRQAVHWTNVRRIPLDENMRRSDELPAGVDIAALPYVETPEAEAAANALIARVTRGSAHTFDAGESVTPSSNTPATTPPSQTPSP